jgi:hypothetical protein
MLKPHMTVLIQLPRKVDQLLTHLVNTLQILLAVLPPAMVLQLQAAILVQLLAQTLQAHQLQVLLILDLTMEATAKPVLKVALLLTQVALQLTWIPLPQQHSNRLQLPIILVPMLHLQLMWLANKLEQLFKLALQERPLTKLQWMPLCQDLSQVPNL